MKKIESALAPEAVGPYSQAIDTGSLVFLSGQLGIDRSAGSLVDGIEAQTKQVFLNIKHILTEAGLTMDNVVKVLVLLDDIEDFALVNSIYQENFTEPYPARSAFAVKDLPLGALVEIEVIAQRS